MRSYIKQKLGSLFPSFSFGKKKEVLDILQDHIDEKLELESKDFFSLSYLFTTKVFTKSSILSYYHSNKFTIINELHHLRGKFLHQWAELRNKKFQYIELTALLKDRSLKKYEERELFEEKVQTQDAYAHNGMEYIHGNIAQKHILSSENHLFLSKAEHMKAENYLSMMENASIGLQIETARNENFYHRMHENPEEAWKSYSVKKESESNAAFANAEKMNASGESDHSGISSSGTSDPGYSDSMKYPESPEVTPVPVQTLEALGTHGAVSFVYNPQNSKRPVETSAFKSPLEFNAHDQEEKDVPEYLLDEYELLKAVHSYGDAYCDAHWFPREQPEKDITLPQVAKTAAHVPNVKGNILSGVSLKTAMAFLMASLLGIAVEFFVFQSILTNSFMLTKEKAMVSGGIAVALSETMSFLFFGRIKSFVLMDNMLNWKTLPKSRVFYVLISALLVYTASLGSVYFFHIQHKKDIRDYQVLQTEKQNRMAEAELSDIPSDTGAVAAEENKKYADAEEKALQEQWFVTALKAFSIGLSSSLMLLVNAILLVITMLFFNSYFLQRRILKLSESLSLVESHFNSRKDSLHYLRAKGRYIISLMGQKLFIQSVKARNSYPAKSKKKNGAFEMPFNLRS